MSDSMQTPEARNAGRIRHERPAREEVRETVATAKTLKPGEFMGRDGEILSFKGDEYGDSFSIPPQEIPDGWSYQWVRQSVLGNDDRTYSNNLPMQANGWRPVPQDRHAHTLTNQRGMVLMERPAGMTAATQSGIYTHSPAKKAQVYGALNLELFQQLCRHALHPLPAVAALLARL